MSTVVAPVRLGLRFLILADKPPAPADLDRASPEVKF
jgi:hypothetical protein